MMRQKNSRSSSKELKDKILDCLLELAIMDPKASMTLQRAMELSKNPLHLLAILEPQLYSKIQSKLRDIEVQVIKRKLYSFDIHEFEKYLYKLVEDYLEGLLTKEEIFSQLDEFASLFVNSS